jgi:hypothetical protein
LVQLGPAKLFQDERINRPVRELMSRPGGVHEYLDRIANDPVIRVRLPQAVALARRIRELLPNLAVWPSEVAAKQFPERAEIYSEANTAGLFDPKHDHIVLNPAGPAPLETVLHESMHAITTADLRNNKNSASHKVLDTIRGELTETTAEISDEEKQHLQYALSNNEELHTMLMTDPVIQQLAARITPSPEFRESMGQLGYAPQESRSVWKAFTGWVRRVVGLTPASDSLLDHILRPLQDITDRADRYNRSLGDPVEAAASDVVNAHPRFDREAIDEVIRQIRPDAGNLSRTGRRWVLQGATTDGMTNWNRALFESRDPEAPGNLLERYRTATEAIAARSKEFRDQWADKVSGLVDRLRGPDRDKLATLMNDATIAEAHLGTNANNDHLTKPEQQAELSKLQARYNALSPEGKRSYNALRDYYRSTYEDERSAQLQAMIKTAMPDATPAQVEALTARRQDAARHQAAHRQPRCEPGRRGVCRRLAAEPRTGPGHRQSTQPGLYPRRLFPAAPLRRLGGALRHQGRRRLRRRDVRALRRRRGAASRAGEAGHRALAGHGQARHAPARPGAHYSHGRARRRGAPLAGAGARRLGARPVRVDHAAARVAVRGGAHAPAAPGC